VGFAAAAFAIAAVTPTDDALTCAELVNDPNRPKTNPAMAMAAMRVMAINITVARTGEIAFLCFEWMFKLLRTYWKVPENGTAALLLIETDPTNCSPMAAPLAAAIPVMSIALVEPATTEHPPDMVRRCVVPA
jgi:hypothetical protein